MIRTVRSDDIPKILSIYEYYVLNSSCTFEEVVPTLSEFTTRVNGISEKFPYFVYSSGNEILGYSYANIFRTRVAYRFTIEVSACTNISVHKLLLFTAVCVGQGMYF